MLFGFTLERSIHILGWEIIAIKIQIDNILVIVLISHFAIIDIHLIIVNRPEKQPQILPEKYPNNISFAKKQTGIERYFFDRGSQTEGEGSVRLYFQLLLLISLCIFGAIP